MGISIGIIAEDKSDIEVVKALIGKYKKANEFRCHSFVGKGCGKLRHKVRPWAMNLFERGCSRLIVMHDLDEWQYQQLHSAISAAITPSPIAKYIIVIPVRELEAWLLADHVAIGKAMRIKGATKAIPAPETIRRPKEFLRDTINKWSNKTVEYVNTTHNGRIASACKIENLKKCNSYKVFDEFVSSKC